jgi:p-hydroxybenzoate 3-monooxygenase
MIVPTLRTQVAIVGAGPAGLTLAYLLHQAGIEAIVVESRSREYVEARVRAGVLEHGTTELLAAIGVGERLRREGLVHTGTQLRFGARNHRIDFQELTGGKSVTVYGQQEVVKDLIAALLSADAPIVFDAEAVALGRLDEDRVSVDYRDAAGTACRLEADYIAGCDGFHGISRAAIPAQALTIFEHVYPFSWLGILAESPPVSDELIYTNHERGFALVSMRSPSVSRIYVQCAGDDDVAEWSDDRFWGELRARLDSDAGGPSVIEGRVLQKGITPMRSFVAEPMRYGRLFLAGDSAHIVPPTGAKGMNLAIADVRVLAQALDLFYRRADSAALERYSETCLRRIWKTQRFSAWMTRMLHRFDDHAPFDRRVQLAELDYVTSSRVAAAGLAENYVGLPLA